MLLLMQIEFTAVKQDDKFSETRSYAIRRRIHAAKPKDLERDEGRRFPHLPARAIENVVRESSKF
jgi:hypothetical protein